MRVSAVSTQLDGSASEPSRSALVTGGSRGIGFAIAKRLAANGFNLTLAARRPESLVHAADALRAQYSVKVHHVVTNLLEEVDVASLLPAHRDEFDRLDVLVLNAGVVSVEPAAEFSAAGYQRTFEVNLRAPLMLIRDALPLLRSTAATVPHIGTKIIALTSITGVSSAPDLAVYCTRKAALTSLCETISIEESRNGVSAAAISLGYTGTDMVAGKRDQLEDGSTLGADDVAEMVIAITRMSAGANVPNIVISRNGDRVSGIACIGQR